MLRSVQCVAGCVGISGEHVQFGEEKMQHFVLREPVQFSCVQGPVGPVLRKRDAGAAGIDSVACRGVRVIELLVTEVELVAYETETLLPPPTELLELFE